MAHGRFDPKQFAAGMAANNALANLADLFGGGWAPGEAPSDKGWRARWSGKVLIVGRRGVPGTFSAMRMTEGWDVAWYPDEKPNEIVAEMNKADGNLAIFDPMYFQVGAYPGWMLTAFEKVGLQI